MVRRRAAQERDASGDLTGPHSDRCDQSEASGMALLLGLATPEAVLTMTSREIATLEHHGTRVAHLSRLRLALFSGLGPLGGRRKEDLAQPTTLGEGRPCRVVPFPKREQFTCCHRSPNCGVPTRHRRIVPQIDQPVNLVSLTCHPAVARAKVGSGHCGDSPRQVPRWLQTGPEPTLCRPDSGGETCAHSGGKSSHILG